MKRMAIAGILGLDLAVLVATSPPRDEGSPTDSGECASMWREELPVEIWEGEVAGVRVVVTPEGEQPWDLGMTFVVENPNEEACGVAAYVSETLPDPAFAPVLVAGEPAPEVVEGFGELVDRASLHGTRPDLSPSQKTLEIVLPTRTGPDTVFVALAGCDGLVALAEVRVAPEACDFDFAGEVEVGLLF